MTIFNENRNHWNGWAAVNPWVQLVRVVFEQVDPEQRKHDEYDYDFLDGYYLFINGLISCDGIYEKGVEDTKCVIWFLNMASAYWDMALENVLDSFNYQDHTPRTYWMIGCSGPFGKLDVKQGDSFLTYKLLTLPKEVRPVQPVKDDWFNCGLIWCLFVYDMMLQVPNSYYQILGPTTTELPIGLGIGKSWLHPRIYRALVITKSKTVKINPGEADHYKMMCKDLRSELVSLLERLRLLRLQSFSKHIIVPEGWGHFHPVFFQKMTKNIKTVVNNILGKEVVEKNLKEEKDFKHLLFGENLSIFPGSLFLAPNDEIITRPLGKPLFPEFRDVEENIPPESIPFDIKVLRQDIYNYFNPPPPSVSEDDKIVNNMALTRSSDVLDKAHEDDAVLPPNTQAEESGLAQKVVEGIEGTKDATSVEDGGATQPPVNATSSNQPLHKDPPKPGISLHSSGSKADKPTLKDPPSNILGQTSPKGSKEEKKKSSDKLHESLTDEELKRKPPEEPYVPLTDEQLEDFFNELQKNPQNYRGGKHLRNFPDIEPNTTQTETDEDSDDPPHDPGAASVPGTPEASLQDSESEEIYEPDDVVGIDPKSSGRKKRNQRNTQGQLPRKADI